MNEQSPDAPPEADAADSGETADASERAPASEWPRAASVAGERSEQPAAASVAGERHDDPDDASADASERAPASEWPRAASVAGERSERSEREETLIDEAEQAIDDVRQRLAEVPVEVVVTNHVMGLYELAAIHLSATPPNLPAASLAIDAVGTLVDGLGDRLGPDTSTLRDALANIRMAFVNVKMSHPADTDAD